jgi:hypothetical protein
LTNSKATRSITLPSKGLLYEGQLPDGKVKCSLWDTDIEEIFSSGFGSSSSLITEVLDRCLELPFKSTELLVGDRYYAFMALRSESYGGSYTFPFKCNFCNFKFKETIDIMKDLSVIELPDGAKEPFSVELTNAGVTAQFRLLRGFDDEDIDEYLDKFYQQAAKGAKLGKGGRVLNVGGKRKKRQNPVYKYRLAKHIVGVNNEEYDLDQALSFISSLMAGDSRELRAAINEVDPRLDIRIDIECPKCDSVNETTLPFTSDLISPQ